MPKEQKLSKTEREKISNLRKRNSDLLLEFGQIGVVREELKEREENARRKFRELKSKEKQLLDELRQKYNDGSIDLNRGVFMPTEANGKTEEEIPATVFDEAMKNEQ